MSSVHTISTPPLLARLQEKLNKNLILLASVADLPTSHAPAQVGVRHMCRGSSHQLALTRVV